MNETWTNVTSWEDELTSPHRERRAEARFQLGVHHAARGDIEPAVAAFAAVDPDDDRVVAARAQLRLHRLHLSIGQETEAWDALEGARELSDARQSPDVELELGAHAAALGQADEAREHFRAVLSAFSPRERMWALAAFRLGYVQYEQGAQTEAVALWRRAMRGADEDLLPHVLMRLADVLRQRGQSREVESLYERVIATDHPDLAPRAALALAGLREERGSYTSALGLFALTIASSHPDVAGVADIRHRDLLRRRAREVTREVHRVHPPRAADSDQMQPRAPRSNERNPLRRWAHALHRLVAGWSAVDVASSQAADTAHECLLCGRDRAPAPDDAWRHAVRVAFADPNCGSGAVYLPVGGLAGEVDESGEPTPDTVWILSGLRDDDGTPLSTYDAQRPLFLSPDALSTPCDGNSRYPRDLTSMAKRVGCWSIKHRPSNGWYRPETSQGPQAASVRKPALFPVLEASNSVLICEAHATVLALQLRATTTGQLLLPARDIYFLPDSVQSGASRSANAYRLALFSTWWSRQDQ
jgi:tetratricopeptide (TPR) repeat protein